MNRSTLSNPTFTTSSMDAYGNETVSLTTAPPVVTWSRAERQFQVVCLAIIMIIGITGNGLVILSVIMSRRLRTVTNVYVVNLALTDLLTVLNIPWSVVALLSTNRTGWPLAERLCVHAAGTSIVCVNSSIYTMVMIAISRLIMVTSKRNYRNAWTLKRSWVIAAVIFIWSISVFVSLLPVLFDVGKLGFDTRYGSCTWDSSHPNSPTYSTILAVLWFPVSFSVIIVCYLLVFRHIRNHTKMMKSDLTLRNTTDNKLAHRLNKTQIQVTKNLFCVVIVYVICLTPFGVCLMLDSDGSIKATPYAAMILILNSCLNPLIYAAKHPNFKSVFKSILKCDLNGIPDRACCLGNTTNRSN
ncbi:beta-4C adrenergic receptor-like [Anneissia japonica]|uniref:beta-4C adrenergic receptor-like n=1 Tax=Anneissia japonica TaxID=1529436 RepID=UPI0014257472|nr:beta-4C adrenergic receptor-like [Anneissia japonica]